MLRVGVCFSRFPLTKGTWTRGFGNRVYSNAAITSSLISCRERHVPRGRNPGKMQICQMSHELSDKENWSLVYEGPLSKSVKYVKTFSLTTAAASLVGSPILVYFGKQSVPLVGKLAIASLLCLVGTSTTVLLHFFSKAYVHKLYYNSSKQVFEAETLSFFGRRQRTKFVVHDIVFPEEESAFSTFQVNGKRFFIHQEMVEAQQVLHFVRESKT